VRNFDISLSFPLLHCVVVLVGNARPTGFFDTVDTWAGARPAPTVVLAGNAFLPSCFLLCAILFLTCFGHLNFGHSNLFRVSDFEFRIWLRLRRAVFSVSGEYVYPISETQHLVYKDLYCLLIQHNSHFLAGRKGPVPEWIIDSRIDPVTVNLQ